MQTRYFALFIGIVYLLIGILGFFPGLGSDPSRDIAVDSLYFSLFGLFDVNILHTLVHLLVGVAGIVAYREFDTARLYARALAVVYGVLAVFGVIPGLNDLFGLVPLWGADVILHAATALIAAYFGWVVPAPAEERRRAAVH